MVTACRGLVGALGVFIVLAMSGCAGVSATMTVFDREQQPADQLPADARSAAQIDSTSTRLLWVDGGVSYFAATSMEEPDATCIVVVDGSPEEYPAYCSTSVPIIVEIDEERFALGDTAPGPEWEQLADSFWRAP